MGVSMGVTVSKQHKRCDLEDVSVERDLGGFSLENKKLLETLFSCSEETPTGNDQKLEEEEL